MNNPDKKEQSPGGENKFKRWLKRLGLAGFLFFFIKGLIWLAIFFGAGAFFTEC